MAVLDAKLPAWQASTKAISPTKAEALKLEGKVPLVVDGGGLGSGTRVLLKDQTSKAQNGLYEVTRNESIGGAGKIGGEGKIGVGSEWTLTRTSDADSAEELAAGMLVPIEDGDTNQATSWVQRTEGPIEVGTTGLSFEALVAGARGNASGDLEGLYAAPTVKEAVIGARELSSEAVTPSQLSTTAKQLSPQLLNAGSHKLNTGTIEIEFPGGSNFSTKEYEVEHGLGAIPRVWTMPVVANVKADLPPNIYLTEDPTATKFVVQAWVNGLPAKGTKMKVHWLAMS